MTEVFPCFFSRTKSLYLEQIRFKTFNRNSLLQVILRSCSIAMLKAKVSLWRPWRHLREQRCSSTHS